MKKNLLLMLSFLMAGICNAEDITICYKGERLLSTAEI